MTRSRQAVIALVAAFALYAVYSDPQQSADAVRGAFGMLAQGVQGLAEFATAVIRG